MDKHTCEWDQCDRSAASRGLCLMHYKRGRRAGIIVRLEPPLATDERFFRKVDKSGACWIWTGTTSGNGYGQFFQVGARIYAHRFAYELLVGPIPKGLQLDHLCHTRDLSCSGSNDCLHRRCVNPAHLEAVTPRENLLRSNNFTAIEATKTHCPQQHPYDEANTYLDPRGQRQCRACRRAANRAWRAARTIMPSTRG